MKKTSERNRFVLTCDRYTFIHAAENPNYVTLTFRSGLGGEFFIASGCDRDDGIDELIQLSPPEVSEEDDR
ncbi:MAG: hypothetical protein ACNA71_09770, partial [Kiritimatiellia bacterium]